MKEKLPARELADEHRHGLRRLAALRLHANYEIDDLRSVNRQNCGEGNCEGFGRLQPVFLPLQ